jgi:transcriptional regulator with XRE-family HTH domain
MSTDGGHTLGFSPDELRRERVRVGWSQDDLASRLGVSQPTVSTWENGTSEPRSQNLAALSRLLDIQGVRPAEDASQAEAPTTSPLGEWLIRVRTRRNMTRRELSEQSGVSEPQIWNIETGKTLNPQAQTRERLTTVLGETPSEETIQVTEDEAAIPDLGALTDFDPHDAANLPDESGVYVFYDISERPVYVGQSDNIKRRVSDHDQAFWFKWPIVDTAAYVRITDPALRLQIETIMIRFLKSNAVINQKNVRRASD